jgi:hypothetical protein
MKANATGKITSAAGALETVTLGFEPSYVKVVNVTQNEVYELYNDGTNAAGASTAGDTGVVTQADATLVKAANGFSIAAAALTADDVLYYKAERLY